MKMEWNRICEREQESIFHPAAYCCSLRSFINFYLFLFFKVFCRVQYLFFLTFQMQAASFYGFQLHYALYQNGIHRMFRNCSVLIMLRKMIQMIIDHLCFLRIVGSDPM
jgi:hypothetical protein